MRQFFGAGLIATIVASPGTFSAHAADCPVNLEKAGKVTMTDGKGQVTVLEALNSGYVRRIEDLPQAATVSKNHIEGYQGFFAETITTISERAASVQYYKISAETHARLRKALPPKPGTALTIDYEVVHSTGTAQGPVPLAIPPSRRWTVTYTVTGEEHIKIGSCSYPTVIIQSVSSNADNSFATTTKYSYSPDLKAWLKLQGTFKPVDKPETRIDRTIVSVATLSKD